MLGTDQRANIGNLEEQLVWAVREACRQPHVGFGAGSQQFTHAASSTAASPPAPIPSSLAEVREPPAVPSTSAKRGPFSASELSLKRERADDDGVELSTAGSSSMLVAEVVAPDPKAAAVVVTREYRTPSPRRRRRTVPSWCSKGHSSDRESQHE